MTFPQELDEETDPAKIRESNWATWRAYVMYPRLAKKYGVALADIHNLWKQYLKKTHRPVSDFLWDDHWHLNEDGNHLMAGLIKG